MNQNDINRLFTEKVTELIGQGFQINPATMSGSQGEIGKVDLRKGSEIIRVLLTEEHGYGEPDHLTLTVGRNTDPIRTDCFERVGNTIWDQNLEIIFQIKLARIAEDYFTDMTTGGEIYEKRCQRSRNRPEEPWYRPTQEAAKPIALRWLQRTQPGKRFTLKDITRVQRVNRRDWGKVTPELAGYEIEAKGKTYTLRTPKKPA